MKFIDRLRLRGLLSFPPDMPAFELEDLNVLIGPNGSGKSNVLEAFELLRATPTDFAGAIRDGGGAAEWLWKGEAATNVASMEIETGDQPFGLTNPPELPFRYRLEFVTANTRVEVSDEAIEETTPRKAGMSNPYFYHRFQQGHPVINIRERSESHHGKPTSRRLQRHDLLPDQSILAQIKDPDRYPELTWLGRQFGHIQMWRMGELGANP